MKVSPCFQWAFVITEVIQELQDMTWSPCLSNHVPMPTCMSKAMALASCIRKNWPQNSAQGSVVRDSFSGVVNLPLLQSMSEGGISLRRREGQQEGKKTSQGWRGGTLYFLCSESVLLILL